MATYVCSDLHGEYEKFIEMLEKINFQPNDTLYILGDVIDRKQGGLDIIDYIRENENIYLLKGNHESFMVESLKETKELPLYNDWFLCGGLSTYREYQKKDSDYKKDLLDYLENLASMAVVDNFILVHGGFKTNKKVSTLKEVLQDDSNNEDFILWDRDFFKSDNIIKDYIVISGHTPTIKLGESNIIHKPGKILVDCGCCYPTGQLACLRLNDMEEFYVK